MMNMALRVAGVVVVVLVHAVVASAGDAATELEQRSGSRATALLDGKAPTGHGLGSLSRFEHTDATTKASEVYSLHDLNPPPTATDVKEDFTAMKDSFVTFLGSAFRFVTMKRLLMPLVLIAMILRALFRK